MTCQKNARTTGALTFIRQVISNETKNDGVELDKLKFLVRVCLHTKHTFPSQETTKYNSCNVQKRKNEQLVLLVFLRKGRDSGPIFAVFLPLIYVLHTANNTHPR